jgi:cell division septum initiation protein DivIVA
VAAQISMAQADAHQFRDRARREAADLVSHARREADAARDEARRVLEEARAEVAVLTTRRDEIAAELGRLSGVIEALAVPATGRGPHASSGPREDIDRRAEDMPIWSLDLSE